MKQLIGSVILILAFSLVSFAQTTESPCPKINLVGPQSLLSIDESVKFKVESSTELEKYKIQYNWTISSGKITRGQGTPEIEFTAGIEDEASNIIVTVKLIGLPESCASSISDTFPVAPVCRLAFDSFGKLDKEDLYGRLDNFFVALRNDPGAQGFFILELDKNETKTKRLRTLNEISRHLKFRRFDRTRFIFLISEGEAESTILHIVPPGAKLTQVISDADLQNIIKGEELDQKIKELFAKK
jgi:hypothetical protein